jgi:hypothetical protein
VPAKELSLGQKAEGRGFAGDRDSTAVGSLPPHRSVSEVLPHMALAASRARKGLSDHLRLGEVATEEMLHS